MLLAALSAPLKGKQCCQFGLTEDPGLAQEDQVKDLAQVMSTSPQEANNTTHKESQTQVALSLSRVIIILFARIHLLYLHLTLYRLPVTEQY